MNNKTNTKKFDLSKENMSLTDECANLCSEKNSISCECSLKSENAEWLTSKEAAKYLCLPIGSLRNLTSSGKIPYYKFGRLVRYRLVELREILLMNKRGGSNANKK